MSDQQLLIAAVAGLWGALIYLARLLVEHMDKALESCAQERTVILGLVEGIMREMSANIKEHTEYSKQHTRQHEAERK